MKDLHIVIVSWNTKCALERCLGSLTEACSGLDWECVVVDNASKDGSVEMVEKIIKTEEKIDLIKNDSNLGFARACNQGAVQHKARYILLLNPDTECPVGSLTRLVEIADEKIEAAILGPMLINADGTYHESVRRFPTWKDQALILLKLHNFFPGWKVFKNYFCSDLDKNTSQKVDQVKGACFLVRQAFWDKVHGLDPRYFIWFEEVDLCQQAKASGLDVRYEPTVKVIHHGGLAFSQVFSFKKQRYFNSSLRKYMYKWHGFWPWVLMVILSPISMLLAWGVAVFKLGPKPSKSLIDDEGLKKKTADNQKTHKYLKRFVSWFLVFLVIDLVSLAVFRIPVANALATGLFFLLACYLGWKRPAAGLILAASELIIGGFGYTFFFQSDGFRISLRMAIMAGFFLGWGVNGMKNRIWKYWKLRELFLIQAWVFVGVMFVAGLAQGLMRAQPFVFQDANAWLFLAYLIPTLDIAHRYPDDLKALGLRILPAAITWLGVKILATFYVFTHGIQGVALYWYDWVRDTLVGEITPAGGQIYRVFFQSTIYQLFLPLFIFCWWIESTYPKHLAEQAYSKEPRNSMRAMKYFLSIAWIIAVAGLIVSLSRSFWMGAAVSGGAIFVAAVIYTKKLPFKALGYALLASVGAFALVAAVMYFPFPSSNNGSLLILLQSRGTVNDAAASSRWNLLPAMMQKISQEPVLGSGFGSTVTYKSNDPRILQDHPDGIYTTYAFEWGWLGYWIKFGIFGIPIILWLVLSITWRLWKSPYAWWVRVGSIGSLLGLCIVNIFTPFIDHPLGFGWIIGLEGLLALSHEDTWTKQSV